jgi:hypothetical protein
MTSFAARAPTTRPTSNIQMMAMMISWLATLRRPCHSADDREPVLTSARRAMHRLH